VRRTKQRNTRASEIFRYTRMEYRRASISTSLSITASNMQKRRGGERGKRNRGDPSVAGHEFPLKDKGLESAFRKREREREKKKERQNQSLVQDAWCRQPTVKHRSMAFGCFERRAEGKERARIDVRFGIGRAARRERFARVCSQVLSPSRSLRCSCNEIDRAHSA